jgi:hypothetical protein
METLKYTVIDNPMTADPNDGMALIQNQKSVYLSEIEQEMVEEGSGLTLPQTMAYNEKLFQLMERHVSRGERVILPVVIIRPTIAGAFRGKNDSYDSSRHQVRIRVSAGLRLRKLEKTIKPEKVKGSGSPAPDPQDFIDAATGERNRVASPGSIATLRGYYLKFNPDDAAQGLFFVPVENPVAAVRVKQFTGIKPSELHFLVPALPPGDYRLEVRAIIRNTKTLRSGSLAEIIEVA